MTSLARTTMSSPIGLLTLVANDRALVAIEFEGDDDMHSDRATRVSGASGAPGTVADVAPGDHPVLATVVRQLEEYFAGLRTEFDLPLDPSGTDFQQLVWRALRDIPYGETITYGEQAARLGDKNNSRAVGAANGKNPIPIVVPCHRVVGSNGHLTGFAGGLDTKAWLLDHEFQVRAAAG